MSPKTRFLAQFEEILERLDEQLLTEPQKEEAADKVAQTEEADARHACAHTKGSRDREK